MLKWWIVFVVSLLGLVVAYYLGGIAFIVAYDKTFMSLSMIAMYIFMSISNAVSYKLNTEYHDNFKINRFVAENMTTLGLVGTVVGFIMAMNGFMAVDFTNLALAQAALVEIGSAFGVAFLTTLVGIVTSFLLKLQIVYLDKYHFEV